MQCCLQAIYPGHSYGRKTEAEGQKLVEIHTVPPTLPTVATEVPYPRVSLCTHQQESDK